MEPILNLNFMHPQYGTLMNAEVDLSFSAAEMLEQLELSGFIQRGGQYQLAFGEQLLQAEQQLQQLSDLYEGSILRIEQEGPAQKHFIYIQDPLGQTYAPLPFAEEQLPQDALLQLVEQGFLNSLAEDLSLYFKGEALALDQSFGEQGLAAGAYLQLRSAQQASIEQELESLQNRLQELEQQQQEKLDLIIEQLPPPSAIPIDPNYAVRPTADPYQSIDSLLYALRAEENLPVLEKVRIWSPIPLIIYISLAVLALAGLVILIVQPF
ncbi:hypothetical protein PPO43_00670 [Saprospira sp. CCB-QB6]|uniref:hypothetical protein n=1 Tax=Saprospira sp. CCB-QB6 TaxID=3023936 RepID=UPI00234A8D6F|nr:hypothetical protein [Saprospira sp. CCB-QB6]WCL81608.1 hypothetical protein PPO43_00670 [Saprospira sp. CCB-QB6]